MCVYLNIYISLNKLFYFRYHDTIECYDDVSDEWSVIGELITSRSWHGCVTMTVRKDVTNSDAVCLV